MDKTMETLFITDILTGEPIRVKLTMGYHEYIELAEKNNLPLIPTSTMEERSPFDWQTLTESMRDILTGLVALCGREHIKVMNKSNPDQNRIAELVALRDEAHKIDRDPQNYRSMERMEQIIAKYGLILRIEENKIL